MSNELTPLMSDSRLALPHRRIALFALLLIAMSCSGLLHAQAGRTVPADGPAAARQLVESAYEQRRTKSMKVEMTMRLVDKQREWVRSALLFSKQQNNIDDNQLFKFTAPADLAGSSVLTREQHTGEDDQWVYVPAYHTVRRIPAANRADAYLGTDYFYEDVLDPHWDDYSFQRLGEEKVGEFNCVRIEGTPTAPKLKSSSAYSKTTYWIEPQRKIIVKQEYLDKSGRLLKRLTNSQLKVYGTYHLWDHSVIENLQTNHKTVTEILKREVDVPVDDEVFTQKALKRG